MSLLIQVDVQPSFAMGSSSNSGGINGLGRDITNFRMHCKQSNLKKIIFFFFT